MEVINQNLEYIFHPICMFEKKKPLIFNHVFHKTFHGCIEI